MGGFGHGPASAPEPECERTSARNARVGMALFLFYLALYGGFVLLNAFRPQTMERPTPGGVSLAVAYGFGLIVAALLLAVVYLWVCRAPVSAPALERLQEDEA